ncbi:ATP-binding protein [Selenomonas ruminantium]|uniref:ATP-binding protein n=1 Tax=Selenomonas ruminantium TaxID=971 RepID=UPI0003F606E3|nr:ATP-binding protein [Selenomonas ruminantium]
MFEQYLLEAGVYAIWSYLAFGYTEGILSARFSRRIYAIGGYIAVYVFGSMCWKLGADYIRIGENSIYAGFLPLLPSVLLIAGLQKYYFYPNWPRQLFVLASLVAGWIVLRFAVSPLSYVLFDYWQPFFTWLVEYSVAQGLISAEQLLTIIGDISQLALMGVLTVCRLVQLGLFALYLWLIRHYFCAQDYNLSWTESLFLVFPCITVLVIDLTLRVMAYSVDNSALMLIYYRAPETLFLLPLISLLLLGMIVTAVRLFRGMVQFKEAEAKRLLLENGITDIHRQVEEMQDIYGDMRGLRHDLRGHIASLTAYVHNHLQGEQTEIEAYLAQMTKTTERLDFADKTGNPITDIILHQFRQQAKRTGISFKADFHYPAHTSFDLYDISVILNNGLKNALEACSKLPPPAEIAVRSYRKGNLYFIEISNDFAGDLIWRKESGLPCTTKEDKQQHGIGLVNIARCAEKYQGSMDVEVVSKENRQCFCLTVMLYH